MNAAERAEEIITGERADGASDRDIEIVLASEAQNTKADAKDADE